MEINMKYNDSEYDEDELDLEMEDIDTEIGGEASDYDDIDYELDDAAAYDELRDFDDRMFAREREKAQRNTARKKANHRGGARRRKRGVSPIGIGMLVAAGLLAVLVAGFFIQRNMPTKEKMNGYEYFGVSKEEQNLVILEDTSYPDTGIYVEGQLYLPQDFVASNLNVRYYYDTESQAVLYTDSTKTYTFTIGQTGYQDSKGGTYTSEHPVALMQEQELYLNWEFVGAHTNCTYEYGTSPARVSINMIQDEMTTVTATKKSAVRFRAGIKSPVLEEVDSGTKLIYVDGIDDWSRVITPSGYTGYIKNGAISEQVTEIPEDTFVESYQTINKGKVSLAWFQVASEYGNSYIDDYLTQTLGITTISPTWYTITDALGNMDCFATSDFVNNMHQQGMEVWPLISDFNTNVDFKALYSSKTARTNMIQRLVGDAAVYGYDGFNIDFENIRTDYSRDFLQFLRELSVVCEEKGLVLSTDNYKPESYNSCYRLKEQAVFVDYCILMAYDEHYAGSEKAGSVASLSFVEEGIQDMLKQVPKEQVITAIPFYTRVWTTTTSGTTSVAVGMQAALDQLSVYNTSAIWSEDAGQYCMSVQGNGGTVEIWFEEDRSVEEKMKKIQQYGLAGVAEWRLGLEKASVWNVINQYLQ